MTVTTDITPAEIAVALGVSAPVEDSAQWKQWEMWISDAVMLINDRIVELGDKAPETVDQAKVDYVVREAVAAQARRPDDSTQMSVSVDDGTVQKTFRSGTGRVAILTDWWALLGLTDSSDDEMFAIDTAPMARFAHLPWCSFYMSAYAWPCSCGADLTGGVPIYELP